MRLVFAGTPEFARVALAALVAAGHQVNLVFTQPDRPSGRGLKVVPGPVKAFAAEHGLRVLQPRGLRLDGRHADDAKAAADALASTPCDAMVVAAYGLILPAAMLTLMPHGCVNIHASILPRWRGAAPVQRAIEAGDRETGVAIMQMDAGLDTGGVGLVKRVPIDAADTGGTLTDKLARLGAEAIVEALGLVANGTWMPKAQRGLPTHAAKIAKDEAVLDFAAPSQRLVDRIRAFDPWPGSTATWASAHGERTPLRVWKAEVVPAALAASLATGNATPGRVLGTAGDPRGLVVATADGAIALTEVQKAGGRRLPAALVANAFAAAGSRFVAA